MLLARLVLLLTLHSLPQSVVEVVVARLDHLGYQLKEGARSAGGGHGDTCAARYD